MLKRTVLLIVNPRSGHRPKRAELEAAICWLQARGWLVDRCETERGGHAREVATAAAAAGCSVVLVCGGDGTINEVINGIAGTETALALIPAGTVNIWARETGIPIAALAAVRLLEEGERQRVDLGRANGRYFLLLASVGTDSRALDAVTPTAKRRWGRIAFIAAGLFDLFLHGGRVMTVTADRERFRGPTLVAIAANTRLYGGALFATFRARADDGLLDLCLYGGRHWGHLTGHVVRTHLSRHDTAPSVIYRQVRHIRIETPSPLPVQVDGEAFDTTPLTIEVVPGALQVIVPPIGQNELFAAGKT